jgi:hypothetical protein
MERYEIGSDRWVRERIEHGLDPAEADRSDDRRRRHGIALGATPDVRNTATLGQPAPRAEPPRRPGQV